MADEQQTKPSFKHAVAKKALAPLVASAATAITAYLMRKAAEVWQETLQPKLEEKGGAEAVARDAAEKVSSKLAPVSDAVTSKTEQEPKAAAEQMASGRGSGSSDGDRNEERRKREQRRRQRRKALEQSGSS